MKASIERLHPPRFFSDGTTPVIGALIPLAAEESRHVRSRRLRAGDRVVLLDGRGGGGEGPLDASCAAAFIESTTQDAGEAVCRVTLLLAAAEPARIEWAIEKATECGVHRIVLVAAERSQASHVKLLENRLERLSRIAAEAVKQCGRSVIPGVQGPVSLEAAMREAPRPLYVASPGASPHTGLMGRAAGALSLSIAIGPEGGFSDREGALFESAGAVFASLGPRILRLETAVVASLVRLVDSV
ncbi:MAG: RsmE family RNA methyltransferase [Thermoanaerobaculia bacterium]